MYIAALQTRQSELKALQEFYKHSEEKSELLLPLFILNEFSLELLQKISGKFNSRSLLDVGNLSKDKLNELIDIINGNEPVKDIFSLACPLRQFGWLKNNNDLVSHLIIERENLTDAILDWIKENENIIPKNIIIDFKEIFDRKPNQDEIHLAIKFINTLSENNFSLISCDIPRIVPCEMTKNYKFKRFSKNLYNNIQSKSERKVIYGDYTTVNPFLEKKIDQTIIPVVQIKYTLKNDYIFIRNGRREEPYDFHSVCDVVTKMVEFDKNYSWADSFIFETSIAKKNKGNGSTWVSLGVNRHIHVCVDES